MCISHDYSYRLCKASMHINISRIYIYLYPAPYKTISTGVSIHTYAFISISGTVQNNIYSIYAYRNEEMESIIYKHISKRTYTEARQRRIFKQADSVASVDQTRH